MRYVVCFRFECKYPSERPIVDDGLKCQISNPSYSLNSKPKLIILPLPLPLLHPTTAFLIPLLPTHPISLHTARLYQRLPLHPRTRPLPLTRRDLLCASSAHWVDSEIAEPDFTYAVGWGWGQVPDRCGIRFFFFNLSRSHPP